MKSFINKIIALIFLAAMSGCLKTVPVKDAHIAVYCGREVGRVNKKVFGNNYLGHHVIYGDPPMESFDCSDYGAGVWDPKQGKSVKEVADLAKQAGITVLRFPGGCGTHHYDWKGAIGKNREHFLYGIDEFLETCEEMDAEAIITVSYFTGTEQDAADLVEYLLYPDDGTNPNGGTDWANERAKNGHPLPYRNVRYFEIGNEVYHGDHGDIKGVVPEEYGNRYLKYYEAMKAVAPQIKIGVVLCPIYWDNWNKRVLSTVKDRVDFAIIHMYPAPLEGDLRLMGPKQIFRESLGVSIFRDEIDFQDYLKLLKAESGKDIPLVVTEYNGGFTQEEPVPYRHCLGTALINAELLRIFMKPEHRILIATYWQYCNSYWGMIRSREDFMTYDYRYPIKYIKRPNYYVFELYNKHFGSELIESDVESGSYSSGRFFIPYLSVNTSIDKDRNTVYLMVVNKDLEHDVTAAIDLKDFNPSGKGEAWILNGGGIDATNEKNPDNVKVTRKRFKIMNNPFEFTFEAHSLTAMEITRRRDE